MMGDAESIYASMKPVHEVTLSHDFYMTKYEITNAQYAAFLNATGVGEDGKGQVSYPDGKGNEQTEEQALIKIDTDGVNYENGTWKPQDGKDDFPVINVTWYGAKAYADWVGGSLPTDAQWEYACRAGRQHTLSETTATNSVHMHGSATTREEKHTKSEPRLPTRGDFTTCTET